VVTIRDGKEPEPGKNEPNQYPGFAKNRTETEPNILGSFPSLVTTATRDFHATVLRMMDVVGGDNWS